MAYPIDYSSTQSTHKFNWSTKFTKPTKIFVPYTYPPIRNPPTCLVSVSVSRSLSIIWKTSLSYRFPHLHWYYPKTPHSKIHKKVLPQKPLLWFSPLIPWLLVLNLIFLNPKLGFVILHSLDWALTEPTRLQDAFNIEGIKTLCGERSINRTINSI